jgi:hypothetical protein
MRKNVKCKTSHGKNEEKGEFESPSSDSLRFKCGTPIILGLQKLSHMQKYGHM